MRNNNRYAPDAPEIVPANLLPNNEFILTDRKPKGESANRQFIALSGLAGGGLMAFPAITGLGFGASMTFFYGCGFLLCGISALAAKKSAPNDPLARRLSNKFRENKIPENVISKLITNPRPFGQDFVDSINSLVALATAQNYDVDQFTLAINHLFKDTPPPAGMLGEAFDAAQRAISEDFRRVYRLEVGGALDVGGAGEIVKLDPVEMQFLFLSRTMLHLRANPNLLPNLDRSELSRRYDNFCDNTFLPHCNDYFGDVQSRFVSAHVNSFQPAIRGEEVFNRARLISRCEQLLDMHGDMGEPPLRDLSHLAPPPIQQEEAFNPPPPPSDSVIGQGGGIIVRQASAVAPNEMQR